MNVVELIIIGVQSLAKLLSNPNIGGGGHVRLAEASELLGLLGTLIAEGDDAYDDLKEFTAEVELMAAQNRAPTDVEWANMRARQKSAHDRLQAVKDELTEEPQPEPLPEPEEEEVVVSDEEAEETLRVVLDDNGLPVVDSGE